MKKSHLLLALTLCASLFMAPHTGSASPSNECNISGTSPNGMPPCLVTNGLVANDRTRYLAVQSNPGDAIGALDLDGTCRFTDNTTLVSSYFGPFSSPPEWAAFVAHPPFPLHACSRPQTVANGSPLVVPALPPSTMNGLIPGVGVPNPTPAVSLTLSGGGDNRFVNVEEQTYFRWGSGLTNPTPADEGKDGKHYTQGTNGIELTQTVDFTYNPGGNGASWVTVATRKFTATAAQDNGSATPWTAGTTTYTTHAGGSSSSGGGSSGGSSGSPSGGSPSSSSSSGGAQCGALNGQNDLSASPQSLFTVDPVHNSFCGGGAFASADNMNFATGPWRWTCDVYRDDNNPHIVSCSANSRPPCGSANGTQVSSAPVAPYLCNTGDTASVVNAVGTPPTSWNWTCSRSGVSSATCNASVTPADGACGTAAMPQTQAPSSGFCSSGTYGNDISGSGPWTWNCKGIGTGSKNASCTATAQPTSCDTNQGLTDVTFQTLTGSTLSAITHATLCVPNPTCGSTAGTTVSSSPTDNLCTAGNASGVASNPDGSYSWTCDRPTTGGPGVDMISLYNTLKNGSYPNVQQSTVAIPAATQNCSTLAPAVTCASGDYCLKSTGGTCTVTLPSGATGQSITVNPTCSTLSSVNNKCDSSGWLVNSVAFKGFQTATGWTSGTCSGPTYTYTASFNACPTACGTAASTLSPTSCTRSDGTDVNVSYCAGQTEACAATAACGTCNFVRHFLKQAPDGDIDVAQKHVSLNEGDTYFDPSFGGYSWSGNVLASPLPIVTYQWDCNEQEADPTDNPLCKWTSPYTDPATSQSGILLRCSSSACPAGQFPGQLSFVSAQGGGCFGGGGGGWNPCGGTCSYVNNVSPMGCVPNATCGSAAGVATSSAPTNNLCSLSGVTNNGMASTPKRQGSNYVWMCNWSGSSSGLINPSLGSCAAIISPSDPTHVNPSAFSVIDTSGGSGNSVTCTAPAH